MKNFLLLSIVFIISTTYAGSKKPSKSKIATNATYSFLASLHPEYQQRQNKVKRNSYPRQAKEDTLRKIIKRQPEKNKQKPKRLNRNLHTPTDFNSTNKLSNALHALNVLPSLWTGNYPSAITSGIFFLSQVLGSNAKTVQVTHLDQLKNSTTNTTYEIKCDLNGSSHTEPFDFRGNLNGNCHTIKGLRYPLFKTVIGNTEESNQTKIMNIIFSDAKLKPNKYHRDLGIVAEKTINGLTFKNIEFENCTIESVGMFGSAGLLVGDSGEGDISVDRVNAINCQITTSGHGAPAGGLAGRKNEGHIQVNNTQIKDIHVKSWKSNAGGVIGECNTKVYFENSSVQNSTVIADGMGGAGGAAGQAAALFSINSQFEGNNIMNDDSAAKYAGGVTGECLEKLNLVGTTVKNNEISCNGLFDCRSADLCATNSKNFKPDIAYKDRGNYVCGNNLTASGEDYSIIHQNTTSGMNCGDHGKPFPNDGFKCPSFPLFPSTEKTWSSSAPTSNGLPTHNSTLTHSSYYSESGTSHSVDVEMGAGLGAAAIGGVSASTVAGAALFAGYVGKTGYNMYHGMSFKEAAKEPLVSAYNAATNCLTSCASKFRSDTNDGQTVQFLKKDGNASTTIDP